MEKISAITPEILENLPSPCWLLEESLLEKNLSILSEVKRKSGVKILLALKGFAFFHEADLVNRYLDGCCASGLNEARLAREEYGGEVHTYSPAFDPSELEEIVEISDHIVFNSPSQIERFAHRARKISPDISIGLRVNPQYSEAPAEIYNPCAPYSRLGTTAEKMDRGIAETIDGLHFHALCEQGPEALSGVLKAFEDRFGEWLPSMKWVNFGGGHHITRDGYDIESLVDILKDFGRRYPGIEIYLEPGEAVGWETGPLVATVLDIVHNGMDIAILDISAEAHMPDTIIMPYRAEVRGASEAGVKRYTYRLAGNTCLAGDIMGDYSFDHELEIGERVIFEDQMHYTMVKASMFNGIGLPAMAILRTDKKVDIVREFGYEDFRNRLG